MANKYVLHSNRSEYSCILFVVHKLTVSINILFNSIFIFAIREIGPRASCRSGQNGTFKLYHLGASFLTFLKFRGRISSKWSEVNRSWTCNPSAFSPGIWHQHQTWLLFLNITLPWHTCLLMFVRPYKHHYCLVHTICTKLFWVLKLPSRMIYIVWPCDQHEYNPPFSVLVPEGKQYLHC